MPNSIHTYYWITTRDRKSRRRRKKSSHHRAKDEQQLNRFKTPKINISSLFPCQFTDFKQFRLFNTKDLKTYDYHYSKLKAMIKVC